MTTSGVSTTTSRETRTTTTTSQPSGTTTTTTIAEETTTTETATTTTSQPTTTTTTTTQAEEAYWTNPWEYTPVKIDGRNYTVTYYRIHYKVQPNQSAPMYEYIVEKSVGRTKVHVYGTDLMGGTVDLGEHEVYEYTTVITPVKAAALTDKLTLRVWYKKLVGEAFIYPWDIAWAAYMSPMGATGENAFVGFEIEYAGEKFTVTNGAAFQNGLFPHVEGNSDLLSDVNQDLYNLYLGWFAITNLAVWNGFRSNNVFVPHSGTITDGQGHTLTWSSEPDGTVTFSGITFKLVKFKWEYTGSAEGTEIKGSGKFSPYLFIPIETEGYLTYVPSNTGKSTTIYGYLKVEDLKLEEKG